MAQAPHQTPVDKSGRLVDLFRLWLSFFGDKKFALGDGMKVLVIALAMFASVGSASAGGLTEPAMDPAVVAADTSSSGGDNWVGVMMTLLVLATAVSN